MKRDPLQFAILAAILLPFVVGIALSPGAAGALRVLLLTVAAELLLGIWHALRSAIEP